MNARRRPHLDADGLATLLTDIDDKLRHIEDRLRQIAAANVQGSSCEPGLPPDARSAEGMTGSGRTQGTDSLPGGAGRSEYGVRVPENLSPDQVRTARRLLGWGQVELAEASGLSRRSVIKLEAGRPCADSTRSAIEAALREAGLVFDKGAPYGATRDGRQPDRTASQVRAARRMLHWTQLDLAQAAGLSSGVVRKLERGDHCLQQTHAAIASALGRAGIVFAADGSIERRPRNREAQASRT